MSRTRGRKGKDVEHVIDRGSTRLDKLPQAVLAERVQKLAGTSGWSVKRLDEGNWALFDANGLISFEDTSLGSVAFLLGMYADTREKPDTVIKRYYGDLFEGGDLFERQS